MSELTHEDVQRILAIIDSIGDRNVTFEYGDIKLQMTRSGDVPAASIPFAAPSAQPTAPTATQAASASHGPDASARATAAPSAPPGLEGSTAAGRNPDPAPGAASMEVPAGMTAVTAPTSGTFYRAASPAAKPFVEVGDHVEANDTVGVFDVMKLFMSLRAGVKGTVAAILVGNQEVAEQGQPLVLIKPA